MKKKDIILFSLLTFAFIWGLTAVFRLCGGSYNSIAGTLVATVCMLIPLACVLLMQAMRGEKLLSGVGISWKINRWWIVGWLLMPIAALAILSVCALMPGMHFNAHTELVDSALAQMSASGLNVGSAGLLAIELVSGLMAGFTINALFAFGEEVGWRGWLLKQFKGCNFIASTLVIGLIWGLWHAPLILMGHNYPDHPVAGVFMMMAFCAIFTPLISYIRIKSGSVIAAAIVHGTLNAVAGLSVLYIDGYNDLLGATGVPAIIVFLLIDLGFFLYDRYISKENIFTSPL